MLARYVPGSVLYVLGRVLLSERLGVPRRTTVASIAYEQAISATSAIIFAAYFFINHPDLEGQPLRFAFLLLIPAAIALLHPRVFGPLANRLLRAFGRDPLPAVISMRGIVGLLAFYLLNWVVITIGTYCVARSVSNVSLDEMLTVGSAQALGYVAALATLVAPAGLGVRDAVFAWAVKGAVPGRSFAVGSLIAIVVRGVLTVVEVGLRRRRSPRSAGARAGASTPASSTPRPRRRRPEPRRAAEGRARPRRGPCPLIWDGCEFGGRRWRRWLGGGLALLLLALRPALPAAPAAAAPAGRRHRPARLARPATRPPPRPAGRRVSPARVRLRRHGEPRGRPPPRTAGGGGARRRLPAATAKREIPPPPLRPLRRRLAPAPAPPPPPRRRLGRVRPALTGR